MNILLIGSGGREHALCWKLAQSPSTDNLYAAPGNPGMEDDARCVALDSANHDAVLQFCRERKIDLAVIGPEAPLVAGLADDLRAGGIAVFGPSAAAAQLEGSKAFTKALCDRAGIPTAAYTRVSSIKDGMAACAAMSPPYVIKADGLAAGKGVVIAQSQAEAREALEDMLSGKFGDAGAEVVIEEFLEGEEASLFAITDGDAIMPFGTAQDHKRVGEGDTGPNTGGMGAYSPAPVLSPALLERAMDEIVRPTVAQMAKDGTPYSGVLYAGLMLTATGPKLIEYNCRFGDPECQVLMMRLESDLAASMMAVAKGELADHEAPRFSPSTALTVVMAANGYPESPEKGGEITGIEAAESPASKVFHAGTARRDDALVANGGRVLNVTALGRDTIGAQQVAYDAVSRIGFASGFYRSDIGWREVERERLSR